MRRRCTREELEARYAEVEEALRAGMWTMQVARQLAERYKVTLTQVYRYRATVLRRLREEVEDASIDRDGARASLLAELRGLRRQARKNGDAGSLAVATRLLDLEARILGLHEPVRVDVAVAVDRQDPTQLAREVLRAVPDACRVLGLPPPRGLPDPDADVIEAEVVNGTQADG